MTVIPVHPWLKHNDRRAGTVPSVVVLHHTAGASAMSTVRYLWNPLVRASYHYVIERDGTVFKCVPASKRAWHAGVARGPFGKDVNSYSVGIAFANKGDGEPYTVAQKAACSELVAGLRKQFPHLKYLTSHRLITKRKIDPFAFDFEAFARTTDLEPWRDESLGRKWNG